ncbi:angiogenic factor with G patch and FHA domains 1-like [Babylonia areolata]|uniref:angiogenic factor with G patch and FHA domains 1-like n=1 Tax=Babylonia areolata TaxID=304850 RepID=UPI003FD5D5E6
MQTSEPQQQWVHTSSGFYHNAASGWYFHPSSQLYYHPNTASYYTPEAVQSWSSTSTTTNTQSPALPPTNPPCIRVVVLKSDDLDAGTFFLVTYPGGTVGREKDAWLHIPGEEVSPKHAAIQYCSQQQCYTVQDLGSHTGTFLNHVRLAGVTPLRHGSTLRVGSTEMLLHIHQGLVTCDQCEPGQVMAALKLSKTSAAKRPLLQSQEVKMNRTRRRQKAWRKACGFSSTECKEDVDRQIDVINRSLEVTGSWQPRLADRDVPSYRPLVQHTASVHTAISSSNKGSSMLHKMGWTPGKALGKKKRGLVEPINVKVRSVATAGLGSSSSVDLSLDQFMSVTMLNCLRTRQRYLAGDTDSYRTF